MAGYLQVVVFPDAEHLGVEAAQLIIERIVECSPRKAAWIGLSGGSTPRLLYRALRQQRNDITQLRSCVRYFFCDERAVPGDHEDSNYHLASVELFEPLNVSSEMIERMQGESVDLSEEAIRYATQLHVADDSQLAGTSLRALDVAILGMGTDGHTASIFPDDEWAQQNSQPVFAVTTTQKIARRLTMSLDYLSRAECALFLVSGLEKAETVRRVLQPFPGEVILPAAMVRSPQTLWFLDQEAATGLDPGDRRIRIVTT